MFSVLVLLEDSENVWSDRLRQKMANPAAKNRFFHFRHAVQGSMLQQSTHVLGQKNRVKAYVKGQWDSQLQQSALYLQ